MRMMRCEEVKCGLGENQGRRIFSQCMAHPAPRREWHWRNEQRPQTKDVPALSPGAALVVDAAVLEAAKKKLVPNFADTVPFDRLCQFFERLMAVRKNDKKRDLVQVNARTSFESQCAKSTQALFDSWKGDFFTLMRLLLPHVRRVRTNVVSDDTRVAR
jgi:hypothetical protein